MIRAFSIEVNTSNMFNAGQLKNTGGADAYSAGSGGKFDNIDYVWGDKLDIGRVYTQWDPIKKEYREMELTSRGKNNFKNFLEFSMISNTTVSVSSSGKNGASALLCLICMIRINIRIHVRINSGIILVES